MIRFRKPGPDLVRQMYEKERTLPFSYDEVGATKATLPPGYHHDRLEVDLGPDEGDRFERGCKAVREWIPQKGAKIEVFPDTAVEQDLAMVLLIGLPVAGWALASARVVYVLDEADRGGYAYGTLPGHPERGEEAFLVVRRDGRVIFQVIAFSRPREWLARLGQPVARLFQLRTLKAYLRAMEAATQ